MWVYMAWFIGGCFFGGLATFVLMCVFFIGKPFNP